MKIKNITLALVCGLLASSPALALDNTKTPKNKTLNATSKNTHNEKINERTISTKRVMEKDSDNMNKNGFYVGADLGYGQFKSEWRPRNTGNSTLTYSGAKETNKNKNRFFESLNTGYKFDYNNFLVSPEIFYDNLNFSMPDPVYVTSGNPRGAGDSLNLTHRFGARLNFGYQVTQDFSIYANAGYAYTKHKIRFPSLGYFGNKYQDAPIFGLQTIYELNKNWGLKLAYDYQSFDVSVSNPSIAMNTQTAGWIYSYRFQIHNGKIGVVYRF